MGSFWEGRTSRSFVVKWVTVACRKKVTEIILFIEMNVKSDSARRYARYVVTRQGLENKGPFTSRTSCLCSPSSKIGSSPLKGCGGNCRPGGSNGSLPPSLWLTSHAGWLPRSGISSGTLRSVIELAANNRTNKLDFLIDRRFCFPLKMKTKNTKAHPFAVYHSKA